MSSTITLQSTTNFASIFTRLNPLVGVGGVANEPALTIGNIVRQMIMGPPFAWRWSRWQTAFLATIGVQDYILTGWAASTPAQPNQIYLDLNGNQQQVTVTGTSGATIPVWNTTPGGLTTDGGVTWINQGAVDASGISQPLAPFGWLEKAVAIDGNGNAHELTVSLNLAKNEQQNQPFQMASVSESIYGRVLFRIQPPPEQNYTVYLTYQQAAVNFGSLSDNWAPIPDYLSYLYQQGFLAKTYEYLSDERYGSATQMFVKFLVAASEGLSESQINLFLEDRLNSARQSQDVVGAAQSARAARSLG